ncbi:protein gp37 [Mycobacterium sp. URHB0021]
MWRTSNWFIPLILSARKAGPDHWRIQERNPLGPSSFRVWYSMHVHVEANGDMVGEVRLLGVRLHSVMSFESVDDGTQVVERVRIVAPRPLIGNMHRESLKAHEEMLAAIRRHFEQR